MESIVESINECDSLDNLTKMSLVNIVTETAGYTNGHEDKLQALTESTFKEASLLSLTNIKIAENQKSLEDKMESLRKDIQDLSTKLDKKIGCQKQEKSTTTEFWVSTVYKFRWPLVMIIMILGVLIALSPALTHLCEHLLTQTKVTMLSGLYDYKSIIHLLS